MVSRQRRLQLAYQAEGRCPCGSRRDGYSDFNCMECLKRRRDDTRRRRHAIKEAKTMQHNWKRKNEALSVGRSRPQHTQEDTQDVLDCAAFLMFKSEAMELNLQWVEALTIAAEICARRLR